jgi:class 3 adenylate cyclase
VDVPDVKYARSGNVAIAYQVVGTGPIDMVFIRGTLAELLTAWEQPLWVRQIERFAAFSRVIMFDRRGTGLSDRGREVPNLETRMDDIRAVLDDADVERAAIWTAQDGSRLALLFAATYPERTTALTLYQPTARGLWAEDYPWAKTEDDWRHEIREAEARWGERAYLIERLRRHSPTVADDPAFQDWFVRYMRRSASPGAAAAFIRMEMEGDVREVLGSVRAPTLVAHGLRRADEARYIAHGIPDATITEVAGLQDDFSWANPTANDVLVDETSSFLLRLGPRLAPDRVLATVMFTDIVGSTERAAALGDARWRRLLERHHALVRHQLARYRGQEVDTAGDGFFATFDGPARAIACACAVRDEVRTLELEIRAGLHTGECELVDGKVAGIAVSMGARVASLAAPGEVLVSSTVKDLVAGSGIEFSERGEHELKGVSGSWQLYAVTHA